MQEAIDLLTPKEQHEVIRDYLRRKNKGTTESDEKDANQQKENSGKEHEKDGEHQTHA